MADNQGLGGERTEKPTGKHRQDARKEGNIFKSQELTTLFSLVITFYALKFLYPLSYNALIRVFNFQLSEIATKQTFSNDDLKITFARTALQVVIAVGPILLIAALVGFLTTFIQTKRYVNFKKLKPDFKKLFNPKAVFGFFKKTFSVKGYVKQFTEFAKVFVIFYVIYSTIKDEIPKLSVFMSLPLQTSAQFAGDLIMNIIKNVAIAYAFIVAGDWGFQKYQHEKQLKMSKQEIKEEAKQMEGDPAIKAKIRQKQQEMSIKFIRQALAKADVVIRNPTHFAVALEYDKDKSNAPVVVAKGMDFIALKIIEIAEEYGVYVMENRPLARALYDTVEIGWEIPPDFYQPVADVLAFVYNLDKDKREKIGLDRTDKGINDN
jgi:flagellar biosynthetic protein FlhB